MPPIKLHYSETLVRRAVKAFWWRTTGWSYVLAFLLLLVGFTSLVWSGDRSWWVGLFGTVLGFAVAFGAALYIVHYRASLTRFRRMRAPEGTIELGEDRFRITSDVGSSELLWSVVTELWRFPDFWLLFVSRAQFITLPTANLDPSARAFILAKLQSHAIKVA